MALTGLRSDYKTLRGITGFRQATWFSIVKALDLPRTVKITIKGIDVDVRPNSPDLHVAQKNIEGEFDDVFPLVEPLKHNFIIDAGGYIGTVAVVLARSFPGATIVTIEPSRENFAVLKKNTAKYPNIIPLNAALGPVEGRASFFDHDGGPWGYSILERTSYGSPKPKMLHEVDVITIPQVLDRFGVSGVDLLKLDIEGAEKQLLSEAPAWVSKTRVIAAELHDWVQEGCQDAFRAATRGRNAMMRSGELSVSVAGQ
jgi:FkbM family methyltransferase